jgi:hypothetical protein
MNKRSWKILFLNKEKYTTLPTVKYKCTVAILFTPPKSNKFSLDFVTIKHSYFLISSSM